MARAKRIKVWTVATITRQALDSFRDDCATIGEYDCAEEATLALEGNSKAIENCVTWINDCARAKARTEPLKPN